MADDRVHRNLQFGPFELSSRERVLRRDGEALPLGSRALDILIYRAERPGEVIAKQELIDHVWSDVTVEEGSLRVHVAAIRKALGDDQFGNRYIANIKGRGYSFVATVVPLAGGTESRNARFRHQGRLPVRPIMMIGRETVVSEVSDKLRDERFVTLLGPGGIGKTTIALAVGRAVAEESGEKIHFVDLGSLTDSRHVTWAVATSLGVALKSKDPGLELVDLVRSRKLLIILDSCEHVIEQVAALGLKNTVARLVSRLELLRLSHRTAVPRHRTLKATLDWSYNLLSGVERIVFRRIARFVEHFNLEGARHVAGEQGSDDGEIFDAIAGLGEKSLLATRPDQREPQYRLLDTTRAYALGRLEEHGESDPISLRHAEYVIQQLESQKEMLSALPRAERVAAYSWQLSSVRSALEWSFGSHGNDEIATRLVVASTRLFMELALLIEWQAWAEQAIARLGDQPGNSRQDLARELRLLSGLFLYSSWTTDIYRALDIAERSQKVALKIQNPDDMALAETMLGAANHLAGNHLVAQKHFEAGLRHSASGSRLRDENYLFHHTTRSLAVMARSLLYRG